MTIEEITSKAKTLKELEAMAKQIAMEMEALKDELKADNRKNLELCKKYGCEYILIDQDYQVDMV